VTDKKQPAYTGHTPHSRRTSRQSLTTARDPYPQPWPDPTIELCLYFLCSTFQTSCGHCSTKILPFFLMTPHPQLLPPPNLVSLRLFFPTLSAPFQILPLFSFLSFPFPFYYFHPSAVLKDITMSQTMIFMRPLFRVNVFVSWLRRKSVNSCFRFSSHHPRFCA